jgi:hypothetical protein
LGHNLRHHLCRPLVQVLDTLVTFLALQQSLKFWQETSCVGADFIQEIDSTKLDRDVGVIERFPSHTKGSLDIAT